MKNALPVLGLTMGDPAGIGPEICVRALLAPEVREVSRSFVIGDARVLEKALGAEHDLYLVDVNMPRLDGYSFLRELRSHVALPQAPAVMVSTEAESGDRTRAYEAGANFYLIKPLRPEALLAHVRVLLGERPA